MIEKLLFDRDYYQRYYFNTRTAVTSRAEMNARGRLIAGFADHIGQPVSRILDAGCGIGLLRRPLLRAFPRAEYLGLEVSEYLCSRYGWRQGSIAALRTRERYDVAICYDVMQYLSSTEARQAIATLGRVCRGLLYFGALTREDWEENCDRTRTDPHVTMRPAAWYRRELQSAFRPMGAGFWLRRNSPLHVWEMDTAGYGRKPRGGT